MLGQLTALRALSLCGNSLRGTLPAAWGVDGAFTELKVGARYSPGSGAVRCWLPV